MSGRGMRSTPMRKFSRERCVCAPQYFVLSTSILPNESDSVRTEAGTLAVAVISAAQKRHMPHLAAGAGFFLAI